MPEIINRPDQRMLLWHRLVSSIAQRPLLCLGMMFYWIWVNMVFQTPLIFQAIHLTENVTLPSQVVPLITTVLSYICICIWFKKTRREQTSPSFLWIVCSLMALGSAILVIWLNFAMEPEAGTSLLLFSAGIPPALSMVLFLLGSVLIGFFSACLCIELQRIYGSLGSQHVLFHGSVALLGSVIVITALAFLPSLVQECVFALSPLPVAFCLRKTQEGFTKKELFHRGEGTDLVFPKKFMVTSLLHGLSLGVLLGWYPHVGEDSTVLLICSLISYAIAAVLLLVTAISIKLDFNHLIYQIAFMIVAAGAFLSIVAGEHLLVGIAVQLLGFCYLHLLMWGVCAYFIKNFNVPATWIIGISTCFFMFGQLLGAVTSSFLAQMTDPYSWVVKLNAAIVFLMLGASLLMMSNKNLQTGWGLAIPEADVYQEDDLKFVVQSLAAESGLTKREHAVFVLLAKGKNRKSIGEELFISEETAKSHMQNVYKKIGVHSQQELIRLLDAKCSDSQD